MAQFLNVLRDDRGATMVEYSIMVSMIAAVCVLLIITIGSNVSRQFSSVNSTF